MVKVLFSEDQHCRLNMHSGLVSAYNFKNKCLGNFGGLTDDVMNYDF